jgi:hypothetical protein
MDGEVDVSISMRLEAVNGVAEDAFSFGSLVPMLARIDDQSVRAQFISVVDLELDGFCGWNLLGLYTSLVALVHRFLGAELCLAMI